MVKDRKFSPWFMHHRKCGKHTNNTEELCPSYEVSKYLGFDFYQEYTIPGLAHVDFKIFSKKSKEDVKNELDVIISLYPSFNDINFDINLHNKTFFRDPARSRNNEISILFDIQRGIYSKFNEDDIIFFINEWSYKQSSKEVKSHRNLIKIFEDKLELDFGYVPSPKTLQKINKHFNLNI